MAIIPSEPEDQLVNPDKNYLALALLCARVPSFANAPTLIKIVSWKFKFLDVHILISTLIRNGFLTYATPGDPYSSYLISLLGNEYLKRNHESLFSFLRSEFPLESEFVEALISRYTLEELNHG